MALSFSTGLRDFIAMYGDYKRAFTGGALLIYSGSAPATADAAASGTLLCTVTLGSAARTAEVLSYGTVTLSSGSSGTVDTIKVNGVEVLGAAVTYATSLSATATLVANQINSFIPTAGVRYMASASSAVVTLKALPGTGTEPNGYVVASTATTLGTTDANFANGVASVNGLTFSYSASGILSKTGTWSGVVGNSGTAGYFRLLSSIADAGALSTTLMRVQGTCGVSGADYNMSTTTLTAGATHTIDTFDLTFPAA